MDTALVHHDDALATGLALLGFSAARETFRQILIRRRDMVALLENERRKSRRRIDIREPRKLWGADLTLVWVLAIVPVWIFGVVDYHGSRLVSLERIVGWPNAREVARVLERAVARHGAPERLLTDVRRCFVLLPARLSWNAAASGIR